MSFIKTNAQIRTKSDLCGTICGIILRQRSPFCKDHIFDLVKTNLKGSEYSIKDAVLAAMIAKRLDTYVRNDDLQFCKGTYYPQTLESYL